MVTNILEIGKMMVVMVMDYTCMRVGIGTRDSMSWGKRSNYIELWLNLSPFFRKVLANFGGLKDSMLATNILASLRWTNSMVQGA